MCFSRLRLLRLVTSTLLDAGHLLLSVTQRDVFLLRDVPFQVYLLRLLRLSFVFETTAGHDSLDVSNFLLFRLISMTHTEWNQMTDRRGLKVMFGLILLHKLLKLFKKGD